MNTLSMDELVQLVGRASRQAREADPFLLPPTVAERVAVHDLDSLVVMCERFTGQPVQRDYFVDDLPIRFFGMPIEVDADAPVGMVELRNR